MGFNLNDLTDLGLGVDIHRLRMHIKAPNSSKSANTTVEPDYNSVQQKVILHFPILRRRRRHRRCRRRRVTTPDVGFDVACETSCA